MAKVRGHSSFAVVASVRRLTGVDPVGHGGTLDPTAEGVLPILLGRATRLASFVHEWPKTYLATVQLGATSQTYDSEGPISPGGDPAGIGSEQIAQVLPEFVGQILQIPPMHSALKQGGEALYRKARRGETVARPPRQVEISALRLVSHDQAAGRCQLEVTCGKGMYVRSLAHDIGVRLGCGAYLGALTRTAFGPLRLTDAVRLDELAAAGPEWERWLLPVDLPLAAWPALTLEARRAAAVRQGQRVPVPEAAAPGRYRLLDQSGRLLAWGLVDPARLFQPHAVLPP